MPEKTAGGPRGGNLILLPIYVKNLNGHNSPHMAPQNFVPPRFGTEFRCGSFWFSPNPFIFRAPARARAPTWGPKSIIWVPIGAPIHILGPNLGPNPYIGAQFGPQFNYWAPGALIYLFWGPWGPYLFILGPWGPQLFIYWPCGGPINLCGPINPCATGS